MKVVELPFALDFGGGEGLTWLTNQDDDVIGAIEYHLTRERKRCEGIVFFDVPELSENWRHTSTPVWKVVSFSPLTIEPSVLCKICGHHGFIREGKWEAATWGMPRS